MNPILKSISETISESVSLVVTLPNGTTIVTDKIVRVLVSSADVQIITAEGTTTTR